MKFSAKSPTRSDTDEDSSASISNLAEQEAMEAMQANIIDPNLMLRGTEGL